MGDNARNPLYLALCCIIAGASMPKRSFSQYLLVSSDSQSLSLNMPMQRLRPTSGQGQLRRRCLALTSLARLTYGTLIVHNGSDYLMFAGHGVSDMILLDPHITAFDCHESRISAIGSSHNWRLRPRHSTPSRNPHSLVAYSFIFVIVYQHTRSYL